MLQNTFTDYTFSPLTCQLCEHWWMAKCHQFRCLVLPLGSCCFGGSKRLDVTLGQTPSLALPAWGDIFLIEWLRNWRHFGLHWDSVTGTKCFLWG